MVTQITHRLFTLLPVIVVVGVTIFVLLRLTPGDPAGIMAGQGATPAQVEQMRRRMGLDQPLYVQFGIWASGLLRGDLGDSIFMKQPVGEAILERIEPTGLLAFYSLLFSLIIGLPTGILAAVKRNTIVDRLAMSVALAGVCIPGFWLGILLILLFAVNLGVLPAAGYVPFSEDPLGNFRYLLMPAFSLGLAHAALLSRVVRSGMLDVLHEDYVRTARAKGLRDSIIFLRHALPSALIPSLTVIGTSVGALLGGAVITESIFNIPGIGRMMVQSITRRDYPVIQGTVMVIAVVFVLVNLAVDIAYVLIDPRLREESR